MKKTIFLMCTAVLLSMPSLGHSKTVAYMLAEDEIIKLDAETDTVLKRIKSPSEVQGYIGESKRGGCVVDITTKHLITLTDTGYGDRPGFYVYDLSSLTELKFVAFPSTIQQATIMKLIYPQAGTRFYIAVKDRQLNNGKGGVVHLAYDRKNYNYLGVVDNILIDLNEKYWFSEDQNKIFVATKEQGIRVYDSQTLALLNNIDLSNLYSSNLWSKAVDDIKNGIVLLEEYTQVQSTDKYILTFFTYSITGATTTPKVNTGMDDKETLLTPDASKLVLNEAKTSTASGLKAPKKGDNVSGQIHIYDVKTGKKLGLVTLPTDSGEKILGIKPTNDKLYYLMNSRDENKIRLFVVDLIRFRITKDIYVPNLYFMVSFDE